MPGKIISINIGAKKGIYKDSREDRTLSAEKADLGK